MKNRTSNYIIKVNKHQIKELVNRKSFVQTVDLCEKSMAELKKIYWFEKELLIVLPILISSASTFELVELLTIQNNYLKKHISELERNFPCIDKISLPKKRVA